MSVIYFALTEKFPEALLYVRYTDWTPPYKNYTEGTGRVSRKHEIQHNSGRKAIYCASCDILNVN